MGLSKRQIKEFSALRQKKYRQKSKLFVVEGEKIVEEVLQSPEVFKIEALIAVENWIAEHPNYSKHSKLFEATEKDLERISGLKTANKVLLILEQKEFERPSSLENQLCLVLERIQDPGNLGTIIRIADWFGIKEIFCSPDTVELYNPKVLQASMGSFLRTKVHYLELEHLFESYSDIPCYGALLNGENVFSKALESTAFLMIGNESKGLSEDAQNFVSHPIMIPRYGEAESLNAAIATGILCAAFRK
jgi:TrmH family RNA methyltransferase